MAAKGKGGPNTDTYKDCFKKADKNGDGSLSIVELRDLFKENGSCMTDQQITDTFVFFDGPQGDKRISYDEFCKGLNDIARFVQKLKELFHARDKSGDGFLDKDELQSLLKESGQKFTDADITCILREADKNNDNKISWDEFLRACT